MVERLRLYRGSTELQFNSASYTKSRKSIIHTGTAEIQREDTVLSGSVIEYRKADGTTPVFSCKVRKRSRNILWNLDLLGRGYELNNIRIQKVYTNTSPEAIIQDIVDNYTVSLTYAGTLSSGVTLEEYKADAYLIDVIRDMLFILRGWGVRIDANDNLIPEPEGTIDNGRVLTNGIDGEAGNWQKDNTTIINHVEVVGGFENFLTEEPQTGTNTTFTLLEKPSGTVQATVAGVIQDPSTYVVNAEDKTIVFTSSITDPVIVYSYNKPIVVDYQDDTSISTHGEVFKKLEAPWLNSRPDARKYAKEFVALHSDGDVRCSFKIPGIDHSISEGERIRVYDPVRGEDEFLIVDDVTYNASPAETVITFGSQQFLVGDWHAELMDRIKKLERRNLNASTTTYSRLIRDSMHTGLTLTTAFQYRSMEDTQYTNHQTLSWTRSSFAAEADCSNNGKYGTWHGTNVSTGGQYSTSGWRLSTASLNGSDHYCSIDESLVYVSNTANSIFLAFKTSNVTPSTNLKLYAEKNSASNNAQFLIQLNTTSQIRMFISNNAGTTRLSANSTTTITPNVWHTLFWIDNNGTASLYIDGVLDATNFNYTRTGTFDMNRTAVGAAYGLTTADYFNGQIDEVRGYNRALSSVDRTQILNKLHDNNGLLFYWSMDNPHTGDRRTALASVP